MSDIQHRQPEPGMFRSWWQAAPSLVAVVAILVMAGFAIARSWRQLCSLSISLLALAALALAIASLARKGNHQP